MSAKTETDPETGVTTTTYKPEPKPGHACPRCSGRGVNADGFFSAGMKEDGTIVHQSKPPSKCHLCRGSGRVNITPIEGA